MSRYGRFEGIADLPPRAFTHCGDRRIKPEGGDGGGTRYESLEKLYQSQADQAQRLMAFSEKNVYPGMEKLASMADDYASQGNRERAAATAAADSSASRGTNQSAMLDQLTSLGINPGDARFVRAFERMNTAGAASDAASRTAARDSVDKLGFARVMDATGMMAGTPTAATAALNSAIGGATNAANIGMQQQQMANQSIGDAVRGGINIAALFKAADGGQVPYFQDGGYVQHFARGGSVLQMPSPPPPPAAMPRGAYLGNQIAGAAGPAVASGAGTVGKGITAVGQATGSPNMVAFGNGMTAQAGSSAGTLGGQVAGNALHPEALQFFTSPETVAYQMAQNTVNPALAGIETGASAAGAEAAGTAAAATGAEAAGTAAAATGAAEAGIGAGLAGSGAAGASLAAAMPWVGAALLAGSALGLFKFADGGNVGQSGRSVTPGSDGARGGKVNGPGGPKDDRVPALLSAGEFVLPVGTVKMLGLAKLEKMRQDGLDFERKLGIGRA